MAMLFGRETCSFEELFRAVAAEVGKWVGIVHTPVPLAYRATRLAGFFLRDMVLTSEEFKGLTGDLLAPTSQALVKRASCPGCQKHGEYRGRHNASEVARHFRSIPQEISRAPRNPMPFIFAPTNRPARPDDRARARNTAHTSE